MLRRCSEGARCILLIDNALDVDLIKGCEWVSFCSFGGCFMLAMG